MLNLSILDININIYMLEEKVCLSFTQSFTQSGGVTVLLVWPVIGTSFSHFCYCLKSRFILTNGCYTEKFLFIFLSVKRSVSWISYPYASVSICLFLVPPFVNYFAPMKVCPCLQKNLISEFKISQVRGYFSKVSKDIIKHKV